jgi:zinc and cadmium transporter
MNMIWIYAIGSTLLVSLIALIGIVTLVMKTKKLEQLLLLMVSFSAGALIGDAFIHILPEAVEEFGFDLTLSLYILAGILTFFILEKFIHWHHCHKPGDSHHKSLVFTNMVGDMLHNFTDGLFIASAYLVDVKLGIATTIAVVLHEVPQELGDFGVMVHGGLSKLRALQLNLVAAFFAVIGAIIGLLAGGASEEFLRFILPFTAGGFIYIAHTDLFPELHKNSDKAKQSFLQLLLILAGIGAMMLLLLVEF